MPAKSFDLTVDKLEKLNSEEKEALIRLLENAKSDATYYLIGEHSIVINKVEIKINLKDPLVIWKTNADPDEWRYGICGDTLGNGAFGSVRKIEKKFFFDKENTIRFGKNKKRVAKIFGTQREQSFFHMLDYNQIAEESAISQLIPIFGTKPAMHSETRSTSILVGRMFEGVELRNALTYIKANFDLIKRTQLCINILRALYQFHQFNVLHLDIKPGNILVNLDTLEVHIIDVGLSKKYEDRNTIKTPVGTQCYMSPEMLSSNFNKLNTYTDIYSMGLVIADIFDADMSKASINAEMYGQLAGMKNEQKTRTETSNRNERVIKSAKEYLNQKRHGDLVIELIDKMLAPNENNRITTEETLLSFEKIKFMQINKITDIKLLDTNLNWKATKIGIDVRNEIDKLNKKVSDRDDLKAMKEIIFNGLDKINDEPELLNAFCESAGINDVQLTSLTNLKEEIDDKKIELQNSRNAIKAKINKILDTFENNLTESRALLAKVEVEINIARLIPSKTDETKFMKLGSIRNQLKHRLLKPTKRIISLANINELNKKIVASNDEKNSANWEITLDTINPILKKLSDLRDIERKLLDLKNKKTDDLSQLKMTLIDVVEKYIALRFVPSVVDKLDTSIEGSRISDLINVVKQIENAKNVDELKKINTLLSNERIKTGFFGGSKLRNNIENAFKEHEKLLKRK